MATIKHAVNPQKSKEKIICFQQGDSMNNNPSREKKKLSRGWKSEIKILLVVQSSIGLEKRKKISEQIIVSKSLKTDFSTFGISTLEM